MGICKLLGLCKKKEIGCAGVPSVSELFVMPIIDMKAPDVKPDAQVSNDIITIPNIITFIRLCFIPVFLVLLLQGNNLAAAIVFGLTAATDFLDGMIARKNALAGTKEYHVAFGEDSYPVVTAATTSTFRYELIDALAESQDYIILLMKKRYAQPLDKRTLTGGTVEEFKRFLEEKTGKTFRCVK